MPISSKDRHAASICSAETLSGRQNPQFSLAIGDIAAPVRRGRLICMHANIGHISSRGDPHSGAGGLTVPHIGLTPYLGVNGFYESASASIPGRIWLLSVASSWLGGRFGFGLGFVFLGRHGCGLHCGFRRLNFRFLCFRHLGAAGLATACSSALLSSGSTSRFRCYGLGFFFAEGAFVITLGLPFFKKAQHRGDRATLAHLHPMRRTQVTRPGRHGGPEEPEHYASFHRASPREALNVVIGLVQIQFCHFARLAAAASPGLNVIGIGESSVGAFTIPRIRGGNFAGGAPGQMLGKLGQPYANEMGLQRHGFMPAAGGGEGLGFAPQLVKRTVRKGQRPYSSLTMGGEVRLFPEKDRRLHLLESPGAALVEAGREAAPPSWANMASTPD